VEGDVENKEISITLPVKAWNIIMNALGQRPFSEVADLISVVKKQAEEQLAQTPPPPQQVER
jgi:hypothetical protein